MYIKYWSTYAPICVISYQFLVSRLMNKVLTSVYNFFFLTKKKVKKNEQTRKQNDTSPQEQTKLFFLVGLGIDKVNFPVFVEMLRIEESDSPRRSASSKLLITSLECMPCLFIAQYFCFVYNNWKTWKFKEVGAIN